MTPLMRVAGILLGFWVALQCAPAIAAEKSISTAQLREDLNTVRDVIFEKHPELRHSAKPQEIGRQFSRIERQLNKPLTQTEAWALFATINPYLADAHFFVGLPNWREAITTHVENGGGLFPFEVELSSRGELRVLSALGGESSPHEGAIIRSINGKQTRHLVRQLMRRIHGDSPSFRLSLLGRRWWFYYRNIYGDTANYNLELENAVGQRSRISVNASRLLPDMIADEASFDRQFQFELLENHVATMRVDSFSWRDKAEFVKFTTTSFATMQAAGTNKLVIDIRANEGGNDDMWIDGILPYVASRPFQWASRYTKRVLVSDPEKNEIAGQVVSAPLNRWINPSLAQSARFQGDVELLVGPRTYSSAVLFANVIQDFRFGRVTGIGGSVRADQTGGTQRVTLPNSGLVMWWPRLIFYRPSGVLSPTYLEAEKVNSGERPR